MTQNENSAPSPAAIAIDRPIGGAVMTDRWVVKMIQSCSILMIGSTIFLLLRIYHSERLYNSWLISCVFANLVVGVVSIALTFSRWFVRNWQPISWAMATMLAMTEAMLGILGGEPVLMFISLMLNMAGTGSLLPWRFGYQASFNLICLGAWALELMVLPGRDPNDIFRLVGLLSVAGLSQFSCFLRIQYSIERCESQRRLRESESALRQIFDSSLDSLSIIDIATDTVVDVNEEQVRTFRLPREEMIGQRYDALKAWVNDDERNFFRECLMERGEMRDFKTVFRASDGKTFPALISAVVLELEGRKRSLSIIRDITDLENARLAALAASQAKSEFLSSMSHEIRTPMNAILGLADLLGESDLNPEQRRYLDTVISNGNALLELINGILDLARVESGRLRLEAVGFDLREVVEGVIETLAVRAREKHLGLVVDFAKELEPFAIGDPLRLRQVLTNLIGNAIKFTERGEIVVSVERNHDQMIPGNLILAVRDSGIGIAPDQLKSIFSSFTQADTSTTRKYGGSGLGLAIVERLVTLMGGKVWVESEAGRGSTFYFTVEMPAADAPVAEIALLLDPAATAIQPGGKSRIEAPTGASLPHNAPGSPVSLLLADDSPDNRMLICAYLKNSRYLIEEVEDGHLAFERFKTRKYDVVLLDIQMPVLDGYGAVRRMRQWELDHGLNRTPIIALTASALPADVRRAEDAGFDLHVSKPVKKSMMLESIASVLKPDADAKPATASTPANPNLAA